MREMREVYSSDRERIVSQPDAGDRGIWLIRAHIDGAQPILIPWEALPSVELEISRARMEREPLSGRTIASYAKRDEKEPKP